MTTDSLEDALCAITGLSAGEAAHLLQAADGNLSAAVDLHFAQVDDDVAHNSESSPPPRPIRTEVNRGSQSSSSRRASGNPVVLPPSSLVSHPARGWERIIAHIYRVLGSFTTNTVNELISFIKGIFVPQAHVSNASFISKFHALLPADHPMRSVTFVEPPIGNALKSAVNSSKPVLILGIDFRMLGQSRAVHQLRHVLELLASPRLLPLLQESVVCYGHAMESSVWSSLTTRALNLQSPASITFLLPLRLSPSVAEQFRLIFRGRTTPLNQNENFPGLTSSEMAVKWPADAQEGLVGSLQTTYISLSSETPTSVMFGIELLRGCLMSCCRVTLNAEANEAALVTATNLSIRLSEPIRVKTEEVELRRQQDRELRQRQQEEYEESLRADRARARERADREKAEAEASKIEAEAKEAEELAAKRKAEEASALADRLLSAPSACPDAADGDYADISLRISPANERVRLRTHRSLRVDALLKTLCVLDDLLRTDANGGLRICETTDSNLPSCVRRLHSDHLKVYQSPLIPANHQFQLISMGAGPLSSDETIEGCGLLPNAVIHLRPACV